VSPDAISNAGIIKFQSSAYSIILCLQILAEQMPNGTKGPVLVLSSFAQQDSYVKLYCIVSIHLYSSLKCLA